MPLVQLKRFILANGNEPVDCSVDSITNVKAEIIYQTEYPVAEEVTLMQVKIADVNTGVCKKMFEWTGACGLRLGKTYFIDTPNFVLPIGKYGILLGFVGAPLSRSLGECGITLKEVPCE